MQLLLTSHIISNMSDTVLSEFLYITVVHRVVGYRVFKMSYFDMIPKLREGFLKIVELCFLIP